MRRKTTKKPEKDKQEPKKQSKIKVINTKDALFPREIEELKDVGIRSDMRKDASCKDLLTG